MSDINHKLSNDYNEEIQYLLQKPPSWYLRTGQGLIFYLVITLLGLSWLIKYPETITSDIKIITANPSIRLIARVAGPIDTIFVKNGESIKQDQLLSVIDNSASLEDVLSLEGDIKKWSLSLDKINKIEYVVPGGYSLGEIQNAYAILCAKIDQYNLYTNSFLYLRRIEGLKNELNEYHLLNSNYDNQLLIAQEKLNTLAETYRKSKVLSEEKIISKDELDKVHQLFLIEKIESSNIQNSIITNQLNEKQIESKISEIEIDRLDKINIILLEVKEAIRKISSEIEIWKQKYLIFAPVEGVVCMNEVWSSHQFVDAGDEVFTIAVDTSKNNKVIGACQIPMEKFGKIELGMKVKIYLDGFPFQEYGLLEGEISKISEIPSGENNYSAIVNLKGLVTTAGKVIPFKQEMTGAGLIIIKEKTLLEQIFQKILKGIDINQPKLRSTKEEDNSKGEN